MDVISILEVVDSVASQVPTPETWKDGVLNRAEVPMSPFTDRSGKASISERIHGIKVGLLNNLFLSAYRDSQAAGALDCYLDRVSEEGPKWLDWGQTGWPKVSMAARSDGLAMLVHMSRYFERYAKAYQSGRFDGWPQSNEIQSHEGKFKKQNDAQRLNEIGFERTELIRFLNTNEISHSLGDGSSTHDNAPQDVSDSVTSAPINEPDCDERRDASLDNAIQEEKISSPAHGGRVHRIEGRGHVLADLIAKAQAQADHPNDERIVYPILVEMAQSGNHPRLIGFVPGDGIKYLTGDGYRHYTQVALRKYLRPETRGRKKPLPSDS